MTLKEFKDTLANGLKNTQTPLLFKLEDGSIIPPYFHITEMGLKIKHFVDCGGTLRTEQYITFQIWTIGTYSLNLDPTNDLTYILKPKKTNCLAPDKCGITQERQTFLSGYDMENVRKTTNEPTKKQCGPSCC